MKYSAHSLWNLSKLSSICTPHSGLSHSSQSHVWLLLSTQLTETDRILCSVTHLSLSCSLTSGLHFAGRRPSFFFNLFIHSERERERERERESMHTIGGGAERGRERILNWLHTVSSEPNSGLKPTECEIMM